jgi:hypothetical protein
MQAECSAPFRTNFWILRRSIRSATIAVSRLSRSLAYQGAMYVSYRLTLGKAFVGRVLMLVFMNAGVGLITGVIEYFCGLAAGWFPDFSA